MFKYNGVIKHAKWQSNTKKSFLYARNNTRVKFGVQIHSIGALIPILHFSSALIPILPLIEGDYSLEDWQTSYGLFSLKG